MNFENCHVCEMEFDSKFDLDKHYGYFHQKYSPISDSSDLFSDPCSIDQSSEFSIPTLISSPESFSEVSSTHAPITLTCSICLKSFPRPAHLRRHAMIHLTDDNPNRRPHGCEKCGKRFSLQSHLQRHSFSHLEDSDPLRRPHGCSLCNKTFTRPTHLQAHVLRVHMNQSPSKFSCQFCGKAFKQEGHKRRHEQQRCQSQ